MKTKDVWYAYPSSTAAERLGYGKSGVWGVFFEDTGEMGGSGEFLFGTDRSAFDYAESLIDYEYAETSFRPIYGTPEDRVYTKLQPRDYYVDVV